MAEATGGKLTSVVGGLGQLSAFRQIGVMLGLAASIALAGVVIMWSQEPGYQKIYTGLSDQDSLEGAGARGRAAGPRGGAGGGGAGRGPGGGGRGARRRGAGRG